jgi:hypothetical protein
LNSATLSASCRKRAHRGAVARPAVECMCLHQMQDAGQQTGHGGRLQRQRCQAYMLPQVLQPCIQRHCLKHFAAAAEHGIAARGIATIGRGRTGKAIPHQLQWAPTPEATEAKLMGVAPDPGQASHDDCCSTARATLACLLCPQGHAADLQTRQMHSARLATTIKPRRACKQGC